MITDKLFTLNKHTAAAAAAVIDTAVKRFNHLDKQFDNSFNATLSFSPYGSNPATAGKDYTVPMSAIGFNTNIVKLVRGGAKPIALGACCWMAIALVSLGMQHVIGIW